MRGGTAELMPSAVLVVEDDRDSRELLALLLELHGYRVLMAPDGAAALEVLATERPCVILLDLMMPRMNGWQFRAAQRADGRLRSIPVVVISADGNAEREARAVEAHACLRKPVDAARLLELVRDCCACQ